MTKTGQGLSPEIRTGDTYEDDRRTVIANGIVVDVIANEDGSVYVELYTYSSPQNQQVLVQHAAIDRYKNRHPNLRLEIGERE